MSDLSNTPILTTSAKKVFAEQSSATRKAVMRDFYDQLCGELCAIGFEEGKTLSKHADILGRFCVYINGDAIPYGRLEVIFYPTNACIQMVGEEAYKEQHPKPRGTFLEFKWPSQIEEFKDSLSAWILNNADRQIVDKLLPPEERNVPQIRLQPLPDSGAPAATVEPQKPAADGRPARPAASVHDVTAERPAPKAPDSPGAPGPAQAAPAAPGPA